ncbi:hypothetical protein ACQY0O_008013 [Thecaphora frezii]
MDFHFGTPSRLERQIAQDLLRDQSELDLSLPAAPTRNQSMSSTSRLPLNSFTNNHASYSRASTSSAGSFRGDEQSQSFDISSHVRKSDATPKPPLSLATAVAMSQNQPGYEAPVEAGQPRPGSSQSSSGSSSVRPRAKHGFAPAEDAGVQDAIAPFSAASSMSLDRDMDGSRTHQFPDPYGHLRIVSPPLTSTPQRVGAASTVGSRSRTTMTIRQAHYGTANGGTSLSRSHGTVLDSTLGSASQGAKSARSAFTALDDLTESSIAPEDEDAYDHADAEAQVGAGPLDRAPAVARDFVVYDTTSAAPSSETEAISVDDQEVRTETMHTSEILEAPRDMPQASVRSPPQQLQGSGSGRESGAESSWRRRREARRKLGVINDESMIDEEDEPQDDIQQPIEQQRDAADESAERQVGNRSASRSHRTVVPADLSGQTGVDAEGEQSGTTFSSPAAARLARQGLTTALAQSTSDERHGREATPQREIYQAGSTPGPATALPDGEARATAFGAATPRAQTSAADHEKMKAYLLNSVKATATIGSSRKDTRIRTLERLQARAMLSQTPGRFFKGGTYGESDESSSGANANTPRLRMDLLGKANTVAAGRTPLPKGGIAELLRRGALSRLGDTSDRAEGTQGQDSSQDHSGSMAYDGSSRGGVDHHTVLESLAGLSETSSNDLTAPPQTSMHGPLGLRSNTSFPGLGAAEVGTDANAVARPRVDPSRLAVYQSKLNARLDAENEELKKERDELSRQLEELRQENEAQRQQDNGRAAPANDADVAAALLAEQERANALDKEAQELADLLDERERELEVVRAELERLRGGTNGKDDGSGPNTSSNGRDGDDQASNDEAVEQLRFELEELQAQLKDKDEDIMDLEDRLEDERRQMEKQVQQAKAYSFETLEKVESKRDEALERVRQLQADLEESQQECDRLHAELDSQQARAQDRDSAESENVELRQQVSSLTRKVQQLENEARSARSDAEVAADRAEEEHQKVQALEKQIEAWKAEVADLEADIEVEKQRADRAEEQLADRGEEQDPDATATQSGRTRSVASQCSNKERKAASLEKQLAAARETIDKLTAQLQREATSPSRSSPHSPRSKDLELEILREQKNELQLRVDEYRKMISAGVGNTLALLSQQEPTTPQQGDKSSRLAPVTPGNRGLSPLPKSVMSLRHISPMRTPGSPAPLSEASWLYNESSLGAAGVAERIAFLESALDEANASIDAKLQKLDSAGVAHLTLAERLERANQRIAELEAELERLRMRGSTVGGAGTSFTVSDSPNKSSRSAVQRQRVFADVHAQLEALKSRWAGDHDQLKQREAEVERRELELADRSRERREYRGVLAELERFREAAASLQNDLQAEQARQREMLAKSKATSQEKAEIESRLISTQAELDAVKRKLQDKMGGLEDLSRELLDRSTRADTSTEGRRARMQAQIDDLAAQVELAQEQVESLKQERHDLLSQRAELHIEFARVNERYESVAADLALSRQALAAHQAQLDEQIEQMEAIHAALRNKKAEFDEVVGDRDRLRAERDEIVRDVGKFESELRRVRREADRQGSDLEALRAERERVTAQRARDEEEKQRARERDMQQVQNLVKQLKVKTQEVEQVKAKLEEADRIRSAAPPPYTTASHQAAQQQQQQQLQQQMLMSLRLQHAQECKGLMLQIRYLKAKLMRETDLRSDLAHQKTYITLLLRGLVQVDNEVGRLLFDLCIESDERKRAQDDNRKTPAQKRWGVVGKAVRAVVRMRTMAEKWQTTCRIKSSLAHAHHEVQGRRQKQVQVEGVKLEGVKHSQPHHTLPARQNS